MTRKWSNRREAKAQTQLTPEGYARLRVLTAPGTKYEFLRCLIAEQAVGDSHLFRTGPVADVATAVAKDQAPIAGGVVHNFARMRPIFQYAYVFAHGPSYC